MNPPTTRLGVPARCPDCQRDFLAEFEGPWHLIQWLRRLTPEARRRILDEIDERQDTPAE